MGSKKKKHPTINADAFRLLFESHPLALLLYDEQTLDFMAVNQAASALYGWTRKELERLNVADVLPEDELARLREALQTPDPPLRTSSVWRNRRKDGSLIFVEVSSHTLEWEGRRAVLLTAQDITPRLKTEEALQNAEKKYRVIFENAVAGVFQSSPQGRFLSVNPAMARMFGYDSPEDMIQSVSHIQTDCYVYQEDRDKFQRLLQKHGAVGDFCFLARRKDGGQIWVRESARLVRDARGEPLYYEGFALDVTAQKRAEEALRRAKEALEAANRELGATLARERYLARTDSLTGLYNYRYFFETASREFETAKRYRYSISILMLDADNFKDVNDTRGHLAGDMMLAHLGKKIAAQMRASDMLARYGGDEFVALLSHADARQALAIAERVRQSVESFSILVENFELSVTVSVGVSELRPTDGSVEQIVQRADQALYAAKQGGRNRAVIYE